MLTLNVPGPLLEPGHNHNDPATFEAWLAALPYAQAQPCAIQLEAALLQLNRTLMEGSLRLRLLRGAQEACDRLLPALLQEARPAELSGTLRARRAASLSQQLLLALHNGYKLAAVERCQEGQLFFNGKAEQEVLTLAMHSARDLLWLAIRGYAALPQGFWLDCHRISQFALSRSWLEKSSSDKQDDLLNLYRQILLLGMTSCNRFSPHELEYLLPLVRKYAPLLQLRQHPQAPDEQNIFVFHHELDSPPRFLAELPLHDTRLHWWQADAGAILQQLQERIASLTRLQHASPQHDTEEEKQLSARLRQQWEQPPHRRFPRHQSGGKLQLVSQLPASWFVANHADWHFPALTAALSEDALELAHPKRTPPPAPGVFDIINTSSTGLLLRGQGSPHPIRTGDIVLLRENRQVWQLGIIRWINLLPHELWLECGIELVGIQPEAVMTLPVITHRGDRFQMALRLPPLPLLDSPPLLMLPGRQYEKLREFRLLDAGGEQAVRATRLAMQTAHHQFIEFRPAGSV